ncbi:MAG: hypothetical protein QOF06_925 [Solirubrobacterales bacterium]|jgi:hypothetical protein|nr:hypothetical protein [Solirubrobacterales bacterium]
MLDLGRYLLGVAEILLLGGFAWLGGASLRAWLLPRFEGAPAHLASAVIALALLIWAAELLGSFGWWDPMPYLLLVAAAGIGLWKFAPQRPEGEGGHPHPTQQVGVRVTSLSALIALAIAALAVLKFALEAKGKLSTGMTGFDSTWYHGPFAAGFMQSGDTWDLHFIAPQFLAWFYPANGEIFHAAGMLAFGRDVLSPLLNLGWFVGCLVACWCIGRPFRVASWSLALGAIALSVPALADQAGEARNDIVGIFFLLAGVAVMVNAWGGDGGTEKKLGREGGGSGVGPYLVVGLAAGLAAGTKLNFLLPAAVLVVGTALVAPRGDKGRAFVAGALGALAGGGYWYLRNLVHSGNPLPWVRHLGPIDLPAPEQALGGREAHSVLGYLGDGSVWSDWLLPGLHDGLWLIWPLLLLAAFAGLFVASAAPLLRRRAENRSVPPEIGPSAVLCVAGMVGLASALAWLVAPTSASGPEGMPRGFESGLRYLAPALVLGLALLPTAPLFRSALTRLGARRTYLPDCETKVRQTFRDRPLRGVAGGIAALVLVVCVGYPVQRHYLESRYSDPSFTAPGLNAAFAWARDVSDARIATTSTRQYPLFGTDLSNHVQYLGTEQPHGGFEAANDCPTYLRLLDEGDYDYVVATRDREEPGKPSYPPQAAWSKAAGAKVVLREPPTVVFELPEDLRPAAC